MIQMKFEIKRDLDEEWSGKRAGFGAACTRLVGSSDDTSWLRSSFYVIGGRAIIMVCGLQESTFKCSK